MTHIQEIQSQANKWGGATLVACAVQILLGYYLYPMASAHISSLRPNEINGGDWRYGSFHIDRAKYDNMSFVRKVSSTACMLISGAVVSAALLSRSWNRKELIVHGLVGVATGTVIDPAFRQAVSAVCNLWKKMFSKTSS